MQAITLEQQAAFAAFGQVLDQPKQNPIAIDLSQLAIPAPVAVPQQPLAPAPILFSVKHDAAKGWLHPQFPSTFKGTKGGQVYFSAEQYYSEKKAVLARDKDVQTKILAVTCVPVVNGVFNWPVVDAAHAQVHNLVREIKNFNPQEWLNHNVQIMRQALTYKFCQDETLYGLLLATGNAYLLYASPEDGFWGIGCTEQAALTGQVPSTHWGQNLLGNLLMELRNKLRVEGRPEWGYVVQQPAAQVSLNRKRSHDGIKEAVAVPAEVEVTVIEVEKPAAVVAEVDAIELGDVVVAAEEHLLAPVQEVIAAIEPIEAVPDVFAIEVVPQEAVAPVEAPLAAANKLMDLFAQ